MDADGGATGSAELVAERAYLERGRRALEGMRDEAESTQVARGDAVVDKVTNAYLERARRLRIAALGDGAAGVPLFFARLDYRPDAPSAVAGRCFYLGRRLVREAAGDDPLVVDWRADVARPFYRAHRGDAMGVQRRRRFGYDGTRLSAYEDEPLSMPAPSAPPVRSVVSREASLGAMVAREIERPRSGPMRDIVATIQPEQDEIVRADLAVSLCVQGAPGTGKTAVGLHRAAYLLYTHRQRLTRAGVLVVGPNRAFLGYIAAVLPALGEDTVRHTTLEDLLAAATTASASIPGPRRAEDAVAATLKNDPRLAEVLRRALYQRLRPPSGPVVVTTRTGRYTVGEQEFADVFTDAVTALRTGVLRYGAARERVAGRIAAAVRRDAEAGGRFLTDGATRTLARSRPVHDAVEAVWPSTSAAELVRGLLTDPQRLARAARGLLDAHEQAVLLAAAPPGGARTVRFSPADLVLVDEARDLVEGTAGVGHLIVDEAQDLSPMQCRALARRAADGSLTVLGDLAQGTTPWAATSWADQLGHLGRPDAHREVLTRGYRVPAQILDYANRLLPDIAPELAPATSARASRGALAVHEAPHLGDAVIAHVRGALNRDGSLAVIAADPDVATLGAALRDAALPVATLAAGGAGEAGDAVPRAALVPASLAKGLEFDQVIVAEPAAIVDAEAGTRLGLRRLYVTLTRAVSALTVVHTLPLPAPLRGAEP